MAVVEARTNLWEVLAGRAPGQPLAPADPGLWAAIVERLNPAKAKPVLREGIEESRLTSVRGVDYVMLRSPDEPGGGECCYLRLSPDEVELAHRMDGSRTVAVLVGEFARISGRLAPDQVTRVVADLAANHMLAELPLDVFRPLDRIHRRPFPARVGRSLLSVAKGQRMVLANIDRPIGFLYRWGGRMLFTRVAAAVMAVVAATGLVLFARTWTSGAQSLFLSGESYAAGGLVLLGLNVFALCCHELGHALAAKHAGRRVPAAGVLLYFGIPSAFVDTTDVWMAGRRARLITTAAGPGAALTLAGVAQLVALVEPSFGALAFKLAFAWYLNSLFNLNPLMALDGYYLLMDWLEIANLRVRGMAFMIGAFRRRVRWKTLDREGRMVALYGVLAVLWLVVAANLAYRMYKDRVTGLVTGVWRTGLEGQLLVAAVVVFLPSPLVFALVSWLARVWRRQLRRRREARLAADEPRRLDALRLTAFAKLPAQKLSALASASRWVHPRQGSEVVTAGAALPAVLAVVDGALEGRTPGDPVGSIRARVGAGQLVGIGPALTSAPSALSWRAAGTRLLAIPTSVVVDAVGPVAGQLPAERAEVETLFSESPALSALTDDEQVDLVRNARAVDVPPGKAITLNNPDVAAIVGAGVIALGGGSEVRRGDLLGPPSDDTGLVATARTRCRLWTLSAVGGLATAAAAAAAAHQAPGFGAHPPSDYPPLDIAPGAPPSDHDDDTDRRLLRRLTLLVLLCLLVALLAGWLGAGHGHAWAEMPADRALLTARRGTVEGTVAGNDVVLHQGEQIYVGRGDVVRVPRRAFATLTFRGGGEAVVCALTRLGVDRLATTGTDPLMPTGGLTLVTGRLLVDTAGTSAAFAPVGLDVTMGRSHVVNRGAARFAVGGAAEVATGEVVRDETRLVPTGRDPRCGGGSSDGQLGDGHDDGDDDNGTDVTPTSVSDSTTTEISDPSTSVTTESTVPADDTTTTVTASTTTTTTTTTSTTTTTTTTSPPDGIGPVFGALSSAPPRIFRLGRGCGTPNSSQVRADVFDNVDPAGSLTVTFHYALDTDPGVSGTVTMSSIGGNSYAGTLGPFSLPSGGGTFVITITARDAAGNQTQVSGQSVDLVRC